MNKSTILNFILFSYILVVLSQKVSKKAQILILCVDTPRPPPSESYYKIVGLFQSLAAWDISH